MKLQLKRAIAAFLSVVTSVVVAGAAAAAVEVASPWSPSYNSKARLIAGHGNAPTGALQLFVGVELVMEPGWKTYWRHPGDSGGLPPGFTFDGSENVAAATVLYPAPQRLADPAGTSIGYKTRVVFPVRVEPVDAAKPVRLSVRFDYGICREICVPAEAQLSLDIPAGQLVPVPDELRSALSRVPSPPGHVRPRDPELVRAAYEPAAQRLSLDVRFPGGAAAGDVLAEGPDGFYLPLPVKVQSDGDTVRFSVDVSDVAPSDLAGKPLRFTMIGGGRQSEATWTVPAGRTP